jgi:nicotinate-nucleotide adenylyltransferase
MRIGLFGGTFDPVHIGHLLVGAAAIEEAALDKLVWIPAGRSPFKPDAEPTPGVLRLRMLRAALAGNLRSEVSTVDLERPGPSYTVDTVRWAAKNWPGSTLFWLIGEDHLAGLPQWRDATELARLLEFLVVPRPGSPVVASPHGYRCTRLKGFPLDLAASTVRERVARALPITALVPKVVEEIVNETRLYTVPKAAHPSR